MLSNLTAANLTAEYSILRFCSTKFGFPTFLLWRRTFEDETCCVRMRRFSSVASRNPQPSRCDSFTTRSSRSQLLINCNPISKWIMNCECDDYDSAPKSNEWLNSQTIITLHPNRKTGTFLGPGPCCWKKEKIIGLLKIQENIAMAAPWLSFINPLPALELSCGQGYGKTTVKTTRF